MPAVITVALITQVVVTMAVSFAVSYVVSNFLTPKTSGGGAETPKDPGVRVQVPPDTTTTIPMVYGSAFLGGKFVDAGLTTAQNVMYYVMAISCVSHNGIVTFDKDNMYYGDRKITFDSTGNPARVISLTDTAGNVDTSIADRLNITLFMSDKDGNITNYMVPGQMPWGAGNGVMGPDSGLPTDQQWSPTNRNMNGLAFAIIRLDYNRESGTTQLQPITFSCQQYLYGASYINPGATWHDYMTNPIYGAAVDPEFVDQDSAHALDLYANELITFTDYNGDPQTQPRYRINGVINASDNVLKNIDQILTCCDSWMQYNATTGKWAIVVNKAEAPSYSFDDSNIIGSITVGSVDITQMVNKIEGKFPDATNRDQYNYVNLSVPSGLLLPNEPVNLLSVNYDLVNDSVQALYLANRVLEQAREDLLVTIDTTYDGIQVEAGDVVTLTNAAYGWDNKPFRAMQVKESVMDQCLTAQIQLIEYNSAVYDNFDINQYVPAGNSNIASSDYFSALTPANVVDEFPFASVPTFDINVGIPITGRVTSVVLFYTTVATPTSLDLQVLDTQVAADGSTFVNGTTITFTDFSLPADTYYFTYRVSNDVGQSALAPISDALDWAPDPANATSFVLTLSPVTLQVPYSSGTPSLTGIDFRLYGSNAIGPVQYVEATSDADVSFVSGSWRIGGSDTTGYADIVESGITFPLPPGDGGTYAQFGTATAMTTNPATVEIPVRYKDLVGVVHQISPATLQAVYAQKGDEGNKTASANLYQWSTTTPGDPDGTSVFSWADGTNYSYTGGNDWLTSPGANPGIPLIKLWVASKFISAPFSATTTTVDWTSGFSIVDATQNGADGIQTAQPTVYQWASTIPSGPTGTSTYTWATTSFTPTPSGWTLTPGDSPSPGYTLWGATVVLTEAASVSTSTINWTTSSITARGYSGQAGASARICYTKTTLATLSSTPTTITTSGSSSYPPNDSWGSGTVWQATPPAIVAGESVYQSDGVYSPVTGNTVWNVPYLSALKVGSLSAISANLGTITAGTVTGALIQTSASGKRVVMDYSTNDFSVYNSSGTLIAQLGGSSNSLYVLAGTSVQPGAGVYNSSTFVPAIYGSNTTATNTGDNCAGVQGAGTVANGVIGTSSSTGIGVIGKAYIFGSTNHGVRGLNTASTGGTATSGLVGVANGYDFYADGAGVNYGPFTGSHDVMVPVTQDIPVGYIVNDVKCLVRKNISNTVFEVTMSSAPNQAPIGVMVLNNGLLANQIPAAFVEKTVYTDVDGIESSHQVLYPEYDEYKNDYNYCAANAVGEGQVYVCGEAGNIAAGDLIVTSSTPGVGMKQSDDIVRNITVAKAREAITFTDTTTPVLVACIYLCG